MSKQDHTIQTEPCEPSDLVGVGLVRVGGLKEGPTGM